jgi:hypothetical protein
MSSPTNTPDPYDLFNVNITIETAGLRFEAPFLKTGAEWCVFEQDGKPLQPAAITPSGAGRFHMRLHGAQGEILATLSMHTSDRQVEWSVEIAGPEMEVSLYFPFLAGLTAGDNSRWIDFIKLANRRGRRAIRDSYDADAPLLVTNDKNSLVIIQAGEFHAYSPQHLTQSPGLLVGVTSEARQVYHGKIVRVEGGWREAFAEVREQLRSRLDMTEYRRQDLNWYSEQFVQHFTFLYGREILDLERGEFNVDRFLDEGERDFGGYDGFLIWGVYPRIGVDERTQWDFYDDMPGGRQGLKEMSQRARQRGVRFFVPYKPWDQSAKLHNHPPSPDEELLAQLIVDTEADGVFLDTMDMITPAFRQAIDHLKPGVVFCSEGRAGEKAREIITGSWDQTEHRNWYQGNWSAGQETMPMTDLWRFILPEHRLFVINRHAMADDRIRITQRGFFNGMGWVVWQDIFGLTLPYTPAEAALLKKCRTIFRENLQAVNSPAPTPLVETEAAGVSANEFPAEGKRMWIFYNENDAPVSGPLLKFQPRAGCHCVDVWNRREAVVQDGRLLILQIEPRQVGSVVEYPRLIQVNGSTIFVTDQQHARPRQIVIQQDENLLKYSASAQITLAAGLNAGRPIVIKLLEGLEVLDQVCLEGVLQ